MKIIFLFFFLYTVQADVVSNGLANHDALPVFPYALAAIMFENEQTPKCIGGFIAKDIVLTTAQCLFCDLDCNFDVYVYKRDGLSAEKYDVLSWEINDEYDGNNLINDIGYIKLKNEVPGHDVLHPPQKPISGHRLRGYSFIGKFDNGYLYPNFKRVKVISNELCSFTTGTYVPDSKVCVYSNQKSSFQPYHQGTPLVLFGEFGRVLYGIYNMHNLHNKHGTRISVYQSINPYMDWINVHVFNDTSNCNTPSKELLPSYPSQNPSNPKQPTEIPPVYPSPSPSPSPSPPTFPVPDFNFTDFN